MAKSGPRFLVLAARIELQGGRTSKSAKLLQAALAEEQSVEALTLWAQLRLRRGDLQGALSAAEQACKLAPASVGAHLAVAGVLADWGRGKEAQRAYEKAIELDPSRASGRLRLARFLRKTGQLNAASRVIDEALASGLSPGPFRALRRKIEANRGRPERNEVIGDLLMKGAQPKVVFDVGANVGQSLVEFAIAFPEAQVYSFEPIEASFRRLERCARKYPNAHVYSEALSSEEQTVVMHAVSNSPGNRIVSPTADVESSATFKTVRGSDMAERLGIDRIDVLKIDTEGHDLDVVKGFLSMIREKRIEYIQVECSFSPENERHVRLESFIEFFYPLGYRLFGIYGQRRIFGRTQKRNLMFGDAVFISMGDNIRVHS